MWKRQYHIVMQTQVGPKYGTVTAAADNGRIKGSLHILKETTPFEGKIRENGDCQIKGVLVTLLRKIPYEASGRITDRTLQLTLKGEWETLELIGYVVTPISSGKKEETL